jgi:hypothetical protein
MIQLSSPRPGESSVLDRAAIDGDKLADGVAVADFQRVGSPPYFLSCGISPSEAN